MPGIEQTTLEQNKTKYLNQDRSVNLQKHLDKQEKLEKSGLQNIEIRDRAKQLGKDDFLMLLVKQLTHQDPTAPIKDQAFIAQMAQFSSLEQMQNMAQSINKLGDRQAMNLVGKFIMAKDFVSGEPVTGVARALFFDHSGQAFLKVSGKNVAIKDVQLIGDPADFKREFGGTADAPNPGQAAPRQAAPVAPGRVHPGAPQPTGPAAERGLTPAEISKSVPGSSAGKGADLRAGAVDSEAAATQLMQSAGARDKAKSAPPANDASREAGGKQGDAAGPQKAPEQKEAPVSFVEMIRAPRSGRAFEA